MLALFFWANPWQSDPRTRSVAERLAQLKNSPWSWNQAEYRRTLETVDVNQLVDGMPLFVKLGIEGRDEGMLRRLLSRGANVNSSDWGCTPLLAALELDRQLAREGTMFSELILRAGADPNLRPTQSGIDRRMVTAMPHKLCSLWDDALKQPNASILRIVAGYLPDDKLLTLLLQRGAKPTDSGDAQAILDVLCRRSMSPDLEEAIFSLTTNNGASLDQVAVFSTSWGPGIITPLASAVDEASGAQKVRRLLKYGSNPNKRSERGILPLRIAMNHCSPVRTGYEFLKESDDGFMRVYLERDWRAADKLAQESNVNMAQTISALLVGGADPNLPLQPDGDGGSLLAYAAKNCSSDVSRILVTHKARVDGAAIQAARFDLKHFLQEHASQ